MKLRHSSRVSESSFWNSNDYLIPWREFTFAPFLHRNFASSKSQFAQEIQYQYSHPSSCSIVTSSNLSVDQSEGSCVITVLSVQNPSSTPNIPIFFLISVLSPASLSIPTFLGMHSISTIYKLFHISELPTATASTLFRYFDL